MCDSTPVCGGKSVPTAFVAPTQIVTKDGSPSQVALISGNASVPGFVHPTRVVAGKFAPGCDRMFSPSEFEALQRAIGRKFTLDGACNKDGSNTLVAGSFCTAEQDSFLEKDLQGHFVFLNGPYAALDEFIRHYLEQKEKYPFELSGCFVVPNWPDAPFNKLLKGMHLVKQYGKGTRLFWAVNANTGRRELMPGIPWGVSVWYDPPRTKRLVPPPMRIKLNVTTTASAAGDVPEVDLSIHPELPLVVEGFVTSPAC